ncbi:MAG: recombinase family protein [Acidobacteria bacterium]|nr:MAG: recombinase family protein [Acidobacteriota bacterium]
MNQTAAIYARVSSDRQKEQHTIASQTAALLDYAQAHQYTIPPEWVFEDEGYSGSVLVRPGLERLRDLIAEGAIETVLVLGPDRLSRNYAYQVLLLEEFARQGAKVVFLKAPAAETPEERLLLQFQGMIAEYERAQIAERCRRGKRHRAKAGSVNVLSAAPYGYRYMKKTEVQQAYYEVLESEAAVVRKVFSLYTVEGYSIRSIVQRLNAEKIATRSKKAAWRHATVWGMLKNPAYRGWACFGKTAPGPPPRLNRTSRQQGRCVSRNRAKRACPRQEWIEIAVPALVSQASFELAQERLEFNKKLSARRTKEPSVLQGLLVCAQCGYALSRVNTRTAHGRIHYYRCSGSDARRPQGRVCEARPWRVDRLDQLVWEQVWQLLNQPELIRGEMERRLQEHRHSDPVAQRLQKVRAEIVRLAQQSDKLIDLYQEGLLELGELRQRVPELRKRQQALEKELESLNLQAVEQSKLLEISISLEKFMEQLKSSAQNLDAKQKQRIVRLLVREVVVGPDTVKIYHSIPMAERLSGTKMSSYRLCTGRPVVPNRINIG